MTDSQAQGGWVQRIAPEPRVVGWTALLVVLFVLAHTLSPLYAGDQLLYFLNGLARAGFGYLDRDWAASVTNVYPLFSALVYGTYAFLGAGWFYAFLFVFIGVYLYGLCTLAADAAGVSRFGRVFLVAAAAVVLLHSDGFDRLLAGTGVLRGIDFWYGVAGQYLIHPQFAPGTFGVLLLPAIALFLAGRDRVAVILVAAAVSFHPALAFTGAALVAGFVWVTWKVRARRGEAFVLAGIAVGLALPSLVWTGLMVRPTNPQAYQDAREILRFVRTPESQNPADWLAFSTLVKLALVGAALWTVRRQALFTLMLVPLAAGVILTLAQFATDSVALAMLVPWRVMTFLVPLSSAILVFRAAREIHAWPRSAGISATTVVAGLLAVCLYLGATQSLVRFRSGPENNLLQEMFAFVRDNKQPADLYLLPVRRERDRFEHFRLASGARQFVDFRALPARDIDVIEWDTRMRLAERFYRAGKQDAPGVLALLVVRYGVTHVLFDRNHPIEPAGILEPVHRNTGMMLFRVSDRFREQAREALRRSGKGTRVPVPNGPVLLG